MTASTQTHVLGLKTQTVFLGFMVSKRTIWEMFTRRKDFWFLEFSWILQPWHIQVLPPNVKKSTPLRFYYLPRKRLNVESSSTWRHKGITPSLKIKKIDCESILQLKEFQRIIFYSLLLCHSLFVTHYGGKNEKMGALKNVWKILILAFLYFRKKRIFFLFQRIHSFHHSSGLMRRACVFMDSLFCFNFLAGRKATIENKKKRNLHSPLSLFSVLCCMFVCMDVCLDSEWNKNW